jgi:hypothetical protein
MADEQIKSLDDMSLEEIRAAAAAEAQAAAATTQQEVTTDEKNQPRDDSGRFAKKDDPQPVANKEDDDEPEVKVYRRTIENNDGSIDVYEAGSLEELVDKIADGKANANTKIRQQELELKDLRNRTAEKPKPKEISQDAEFVYQQEMMKNPTKAVRAIFKELTGVDIEEISTIAERNRMINAAQAHNSAIESFIATHPDYEDAGDVGKKNGDLMALAIGTGQPATPESLHKAYLHLKKSRLLVLKGEEAHVDTKPKPEVTQPTVETKVEVTQQRTRKGSGVSTQGAPAPVQKKATELSKDELEAMIDSGKLSLDELRDLDIRRSAATR